MDRPTNQELHETYEGMAVSFAHTYYTNSPWLVEDIRNEAICAIFEAADKFDWASVENYKGWQTYLKKVVMSRCRTLVANIGYSTSGASDWALRGTDFTLHRSGSLATYEWHQGRIYAGGAVWGDGGEDAEMFQALVRVAAEVLTDHQLLIFEMYYVDGITSDAQIAEKLDLQPESVKKVRSRALKRIRQEVLDQQMADEEI